LDDTGRAGEARALFTTALPGIILEGLLKERFSKEFMVRRGIFRNIRTRATAAPIDKHDMREIDLFWEQIAPHLTA
jgi:hypothetical protein